MKDSVCLIIPAFNEERNIREAVSRSKKLTKHVLVIDDGSRDRTAEVAKKAGAIVIKHKTNKGKGEALNTAFEWLKKSRTKHIVVLDADMQYEPEEAPKMLVPLQRDEADFVMGSRDWSTIPWRHRLGNAVWHGLFNLFFGTRLTDTNCGLIAFNRNALKAIGKTHGGYIIENQMLATCVRKGLRIKNVPVRVTYKHKSKVPRGIRVVLGVSWFIVTEGLKYRLKR